MATIDQLQIEINANASGAEDAVNRLINKLHGLNSALNLNFGDNLTSSLHNLSDSLLSVQNAVNGIDAVKLKEVAGALRSLSTQGKNLAGLSAITTNVSKGLGSVTDKAKETAKMLATKFNIKGAGNIEALTEAVKQFYDAADDPVAARKALDFLKDIVTEYGTYADKIDEFEQKVAKAIRSADLRIPQGAYKEFQDGEMNYIRGLFGISNTRYGKGMDMSDVAAQINNEFGTRFETKDDISAMAQMGKYLEKTRDNAISVRDAMDQIPEYAEQVEKTFRDIAEAAGIIVSNIQEMNYIPLDLDDDFSPETVSMMEQSSIAMKNIAQGASNAAPQIANLADSMGKVNESGTIFDGIVNGLLSLEGLGQMPDFSQIKVLADSMSKLSGENIQRAADALPQIGASIHVLGGVTIPNLEGLETLAHGLRSLGSKTVVNAADSMPKIIKALEQFQRIHLGDNIAGISELSNAIIQFGYKSAAAAAENIPKISKAFVSMTQALSKAPAVSENTIRLAEAMAQLAQAMGQLSNNGNRVQNGMRRASRGLHLFNNTATKTRKTTHSLASTIGKITATYWLLFRALSKVKQAIDLSSDLTEVQNVVDQTFKNESYKMNDFAKESIKNFGMAQLQAKEVGSRFQAMGTAMEIPNKAIEKSSEFLAKNSRMYGQNAKSMADMSIELTKLTADMGSFYNKDYAEVAEDMEAIFTGQTRPLRQYGLDLSIATLREFALKNGLDANIKSMSQAQKTMLRYQYVLAQTGAAQGDFARTSNTWANQTRMLKQNFEELGIVIGKIFINAFKPAVKAMNAFIQKITSFAEQVFNALGQIFGWEVEIDAAGIADDFGDAADAAEGIADGTGDAAKNAKELNKQLAGFDRLNNLTTQSDKNSGSGSGSGSGVAGGGTGKDDGYVKTKFKKVESNIKDLETLGATIANTIADSLDSINWEKDVYPSVEKFATGLADFMNGLFAGEAGKNLFESLGATVAGAINSVFIAWDTWAKKIKWSSIGRNIRKGVVKFLKKWQPKIAGSALGGLAKGIAEGVYAAVSDKKAWKLLGKKIGTAIESALKTFNKKDKKGRTGWQNAFGSMAHVANGLSSAVLEAVKKIDWIDLGKAIKTGIQDFLKTWEPKISGTALAKLARGIADSIYEVVSDKKIWKDLGSKISEGLNAFFKEMNKVGKNGMTGWETLFADLTDTLLGLATAIGNAIASIDWGEALGGIYKGLKKAFKKALKNPEGVVSLIGLAVITKFGKAIGVAIAPSIGKGIASGLAGSSLLGNEILGGLGAGLAGTVPLIEQLEWLSDRDSTGVREATEEEKRAYDNFWSNVLGKIKKALGAIVFDVSVNAQVNKIKTDKLTESQKVIKNTVAEIYKAEMGKIPIEQRTIPGVADFVQAKAENLAKKERTIPGVIDFRTTQYKNKEVSKNNPVTIPGKAEFEKWQKAKGFNNTVTGMKAGLSKKKIGFSKNVDGMTGKIDKFEASKKLTTINVTAKITKWESSGNLSDDLARLDPTSGDLAQVYQNSKKVGNNVADGVVEGVNEKTSGKKNVFSSFFTWVFDALKEVFDINSPAKKMKPIGKYIVQGIIAGFSDVDLVEEFKGWLNGLWGKLTGSVSDVAVSATVKLDTTKKDVGGWVTDIKSWWNEKTKALNQSVSSTATYKKVSGWYSNIKTWWGKASSAISVAFTVTKTTLVNLFNTVSAYFGQHTVNVKTGHSSSGGSKFSATGGVYKNSKWHDIPQFASGGAMVPTHGSMFVAGEHGAEVVGHVGGQTEVLNKSQLASVMYSAVNSAMAQQNAILMKQNEYLAGILAKDYGISSRDIFNATRSEATSYYNRTGRPAFEG